MSEERKYVAVCGPMAAGKSTAAALIATTLGWTPVLEDLGQHPFIVDYYADMKRWCFHTVVAFLVRGLTLQEHIRELLASSSVCQDWYFGEHYDIYGVHVYEEGLIDERERRVCEELHRALMSHARAPDLLVVLRADAETLQARVAARQRSTEKQVPLDYLRHLVTRYDEWISTLDIPCLVVDTAVADLVRDSGAQRAFLEDVKRSLR